MSEKISQKVAPGVAVGDDVQAIFANARAYQFALPAVNVVGTNSINAVMEAAKKVQFTCHYTVFKRKADRFMQAKASQTKTKNRLSQVRFQEHFMFTNWLNYMVFR